VQKEGELILPEIREDGMHSLMVSPFRHLCADCKSPAANLTSAGGNGEDATVCILGALAVVLVHPLEVGLASLRVQQSFEPTHRAERDPQAVGAPTATPTN
jgi:hypothetical protein